MMHIRNAVTFIALGWLALAAAPEPAAAQGGFDGPHEGRFIQSETLGEIDLGPEIPGMEGRHLRLRFWTVGPDGVVPVHSHANRPAMIYFLEGEIIEHRSDKAEPTVYGPGGVSIEAAGVSHWWENQGDVPVTMIAIDIYQDAM